MVSILSLSGEFVSNCNFFPLSGTLVMEVMWLFPVLQHNNKCCHDDVGTNIYYIFPQDKNHKKDFKSPDHLKIIF